jgi:NAD(P)-dependent dehydrogenase (short-subunit alcohol dehydrogenase family)
LAPSWLSAALRGRITWRVIQKIGPLDIVVASAADIMVKPLVECTEDDYDRIFRTNAKGVWLQPARRGGLA